MDMERLLVLANLMALFIVGWLWFDVDSTRKSVERAEAKQVRSVAFAEEIELLRTELAECVVIKAEDYDSSVAVSDAVKAAKLYGADFSTGPTGERSLDKTGVRKCSVSLPKYQISLRQIVELVSCLSGSEVNFQVASIQLDRPKGDPSKGVNREVWDVFFTDVVYLKFDAEAK